MENKLGISELKDVVSFACALVNAGDGALADGKVGIDDAFQMLAPLQKVGPALAGIGSVPAEFADLDQAEAQELSALVKSELKLEAHPGAEAIAELVVNAGLNIVAAIVQAKAAKAAPSA